MIDQAKHENIQPTLSDRLRQHPLMFWSSIVSVSVVALVVTYEDLLWFSSDGSMIVDFSDFDQKLFLVILMSLPVYLLVNSEEKSDDRILRCLIILYPMMWIEIHLVEWMWQMPGITELLDILLYPIYGIVLAGRFFWCWSKFSRPKLLLLTVFAILLQIIVRCTVSIRDMPPFYI